MRLKSSPQEEICKWPESEQSRACLSIDHLLLLWVPLRTSHPPRPSARPEVPVCPLHLSSQRFDPRHHAHG